MVLEEKQKYISVKQDRKPRNKPCAYGQLIYNKADKNTQWGKGLFSEWCWETEQVHVKE